MSARGHIGGHIGSAAAHATALAVLAAIAAGGCAASSGKVDSDGGAGGSTGAGSGGFNGTGSGGSGAGGQGGTSTTGSGGSVGTGAGGNGGGSSDAGVGDGGGRDGSTDAGGTGTGGATGSGGAGGGASCAVSIKLVAGGDFNDLPSGPQAKLRVRGVVTGTAPAGEPTWTWTVSVDGASPVAMTRDAADPSVAEYPLTREAYYRVQVSVGGPPGQVCRGEQPAHASPNPKVTYWVRVSPPPGMDLPPSERPVTVSAGKPAPLDFPFILGLGTMASISPRGTFLGQLTTVPAYVRLWSTGQSWSREGNAINGPFKVRIADDASRLYNVLVIPLAMGSELPPAPLLFQSQKAQFVSEPFTVDSGFNLAGTTDVEGGGAVAGATILLRAGDLPSTIGTSDAAGAFTVRARAGRFSATILAPDGGSLPDARVDAADGGGVDLGGFPVVVPSLRFSWHAAASTSLSVTATRAGLPAADLDVRLDSEEGALPDVGTLYVGAQPQTAQGVVHRRGVTDGAGKVTFTSVPRARYRVSAVPDVTSSEGLTVVPVDLSQGTGRTLAVPLAAKVRVSGKLTAALPNTRIIVVDDQPLFGRSFPSFEVLADGTYTLSLDPARSYRALVDPPRGSGVARVRLAPIITGTSDPAPLPARGLPNMVPVTAIVYGPGGVTPLAGAVVQVFCMGDTPDCIDNSNLAGHDPLPLNEVVTDAAGNFNLPVPDPAPLPN